MTKVCEICGKEFNAVTSKKYCSRECVSQVELKRALEKYYKKHPERYERFSGKWYRNSPEKLRAARKRQPFFIKKTIHIWNSAAYRIYLTTRSATGTR